MLRIMSPTEALLWQAIRGRKLANMKFRRQQIIDGCIADFDCDEVGLVVELVRPLLDSQIDFDELRNSVMGIVSRIR